MPKTPDDIARVVIENRGGTPITVGNIASVHESLAPKSSLVSSNGREAVLPPTRGAADARYRRRRRASATGGSRARERAHAGIAGAIVDPASVVLTIVDPARSVVIAQIGERDAAIVRAGGRGAHSPAPRTLDLGHGRARRDRDPRTLRCDRRSRKFGRERSRYGSDARLHSASRQRHVRTRSRYDRLAGRRTDRGLLRAASFR